MALIGVLATGCSFELSAIDGGVPEDATPDGQSAGGDAPGATTDATAAIDAPATTCPSGFVIVPGAPSTSRYQVVSVPQTYLTALATCAAMGTHLLKLDTQAEATALEAFIDAALAGSDSHIYRVIGVRDAIPNPDRWLDGVTPLTFLPWGVNEPTNQPGEDCIGLRKENGSPATKVIGADQCGTAHELACECD